MYLWIVFYLNENYFYFYTFLNIYIYIYIYMYVYYQVWGPKRQGYLKKNSNYLGYFPHKKNFKNFGGSQAPLGHQGVGM